MCTETCYIGIYVSPYNHSKLKRIHVITDKEVKQYRWLNSVINYKVTKMKPN